MDSTTSMDSFATENSFHSPSSVGDSPFVFRRSSQKRRHSGPVMDPYSRVPSSVYVDSVDLDLDYGDRTDDAAIVSHHNADCPSTSGGGVACHVKHRNRCRRMRSNSYHKNRNLRSQVINLNRKSGGILKRSTAKTFLLLDSLDSFVFLL